MNKVFKFNFLYFSLLCFIILNLCCEQADSYGNYIPEDDPFTYLFNINSEIINPLNTGIDYADTDDDYTEITIHLLKTLNGNNDYLVPNEEINISWTISNEDYQSFPKIEHNNSEISNGETLLVDDSGTAVLKWLDKGIYGDVIINCSFTDINSNTWKSSEQNDQSIEILNNTFTITPVTYNLDVAIDIKSDEGTNYEGDYSDFTDMDKIQNENTSYTEVNISLNKNEVNLPASLKSITIDLAGEFNQSDGYFLTANSEQVTDGDQILTDSEGNIKLYWIDQGKSGLIQFTCIYFPIMDNPLAPFNSFTVASQYEKVEEIIAYEYEPINLTNGIPALEPIEVRVKDEFQGGVEYIDVLINPGTCNNCPEIIWTNGTVSQTNSDGVASFFFTLSNEGVVEDNIELSYNFLISNSNLNCGSCINNELNSSAQAIAFELDTATAPEEVHIFELTLDPSPFIFNDLPEAVNDTTFSDSIIIEATVKREGGSGIENLPVYFENILPESGNSYGVLDQMAITDSDGIARNVLKNINTNNLDPSNPTDIITIKATIEGNDVTYEATTSTTIIAKSLENISHVNNMDFYFEQNINFTVEGVTFTDVVIAQVLDENSAPVQGVPIQFYLSTDDIGYISSDLEYSDSQGFATVAYNVNAADILLADGSQTTINISAYVNDDHNQNLDRTYYVDPVQLISTLELNLTPEVLIYNDLPGFETGVIDSIGISVYVKDAWGVGVPQIPVSFANNTPNYGILETPVVITDNLGIATNKLSNINTSSFDFVNNTTDIIEIYASAIGIDAGGFEELYDATSITTIVPQSLQNIWQVEQLDVYFAQQLSVINNITVAFSDTIVAQVLDENSVPVSGVPINFELVSENEVGYITSNLEISDVNGFARSIFHINPADFEAFDDVNDTAVITINTTVGEDFTDSITKSYQIEGNSYIEYEVDELYPVTYEPLDEVYSFGVEWDNSLESFEFQFRDLCFQAKDSDGVIIENVPIQFSLFSKNDETNGSLSESLVYSCCINGQDSTNTASLPYSNSELYYEYMIDLGYPSSIAEDTLGVGCLTYSVWDIAYEDFENPDSLYVTIADPNDQSTDIFNRTYALELNPYSYPQTVDASSFDLVMDPPQNTANDPLLLIYNDLPPNIDPALTDTVGLSVLVTDELGASISNVEIEFTNMTNYGALTSTSVDTNEDGIAKNLLDNITSTFYEEFDYENEVQDIIEVQIDAIVNNESVATDIESILIIPQSIYNVNQVNSLSLNFNDPTNFTIYEADNSTFTDQIQAQVLTATNSPYGNVPIEFSLNSDFG